MKKQVMVIGLGQFGLALARSLSEKGAEVLAIDIDKALVRSATSFVVEAICMDATDEQQLAQLAPERRDICVSSIGNEAKEVSIICVALLRQLGARHVVARAFDPVHERILRLVGAHEIVNPEREFGERFASRLAYRDIIGEMPLGHDLTITEMHVPPAFVGRNLSDLLLPKKYRITVVATRSTHDNEIKEPDPHSPLKASDIMIVVARKGVVPSLLERF